MVVPVGRLGVVALSAARSTHQQALGGRTGTIGSMHRQRKKESPAGAGRGLRVSVDGDRPPVRRGLGDFPPARQPIPSNEGS